MRALVPTQKVCEQQRMRTATLPPRKAEEKVAGLLTSNGHALPLRSVAVRSRVVDFVADVRLFPFLI